MNKKAVNTLTVILCLGVVLVLPPIALIFDKPANIAGIPLVVLYLFGVWFLLVLAAFVLSTCLPKDNPRDAEQ